MRLEHKKLEELLKSEYKGLLVFIVNNKEFSSEGEIIGKTKHTKGFNSKERDSKTKNKVNTEEKVSPFSKSLNFKEIDALLPGLIGKIDQKFKRCIKGKGIENFSLDFLFNKSEIQVAVVTYNDNVNTNNESTDNNLYFNIGALINHLALETESKESAIYQLNANIKAQKSEESKESTDSILQIIEGYTLAGYKFTKYKSLSSEEKKDFSLKPSITLLNFSDQILTSNILNPIKKDKKSLDADKKTNIKELGFNTDLVSSILAYTESTTLTRDLVNMGPSDCTPSYLVNTSKEVAKKNNLSIKIYGKPELQKIGANGILSVSRGSDEPAFLIQMTYKPKLVKSNKIIALVGKGVTFDSGGLSIKPADSMEEMKGDMAGAAAVIGAMNGIAKLKLGVEVRAYIPTVENMINGKAVKPGDVYTSLKGKTVEILNTDAEGRLILADAIALAEKDGADIIVDIATLTGAVVVALGEDVAGVFTDSDYLAVKVIEAGRASGEDYWRLPFYNKYKEKLKSKISDLKNITGNRWGGAINAALFLKEFIDKAELVHLDIAGPALNSRLSDYSKDTAPGFGTRTLIRFVKLLSLEPV